MRRRRLLPIPLGALVAALSASSPWMVSASSSWGAIESAYNLYSDIANLYLRALQVST